MMVWDFALGLGFGSLRCRIFGLAGSHPKNVAWGVQRNKYISEYGHGAGNLRENLLERLMNLNGTC